MSDYDKKIGKLKEDLDKAKNMKIRAEARLEELTKQRDEIIKEITSFGISPDNIDNEITKIDSEIVQMISEIESLLPRDIIDKN